MTDAIGGAKPRRVRDATRAGGVRGYVQVISNGAYITGSEKRVVLAARLRTGKSMAGTRCVDAEFGRVSLDARE